MATKMAYKQASGGVRLNTGPLIFGAELIGGGRQVGLAERVLAGAQVAWPLAVVLARRRSQSRARMRRARPAGADMQN